MQLLTGADVRAMRDARRGASRERFVSAIIVNYHSADDVLRCVESLLGQEELGEIIVVDNASTDDSVARITAAAPPVLLVANDENAGYGGGANLGAWCASGDVLLVLNPDTRLTGGSVAALARHVRATGDLAGPVTVESDSGLRKLGEQMDWLGMPKARASEDEPLFALQGNALAVDAVLFDALGGFDERLFLFFEDIELCWRARLAGRDLATLPEAQVLHDGGGSIGGGYVRAEGRTTSDLRFAMRERNTLTVFLSCAPLWVLPFFVPAHVAKVVLTAGFVLLRGRPRLAGELLGGLTWNVRQVPAARRRRRSAPLAASRTSVFLAHSTRGLNALSIIRSDGVPRFVS